MTRPDRIRRPVSSDLSDRRVGRALAGFDLASDERPGGLASLRLAARTPRGLVTIAATTEAGSGSVDGSGCASSPGARTRMSRARSATVSSTRSSRA